MERLHNDNNSDNNPVTQVVSKKVNVYYTLLALACTKCLKVNLKSHHTLTRDCFITVTACFIYNKTRVHLNENIYFKVLQLNYKFMSLQKNM